VFGGFFVPLGSVEDILGEMCSSSIVVLFLTCCVMMGDIPHFDLFLTGCLVTGDVPHSISCVRDIRLSKRCWMLKLA